MAREVPVSMQIHISTRRSCWGLMPAIRQPLVHPCQQCGGSLHATQLEGVGSGFGFPPRPTTLILRLRIGFHVGYNYQTLSFKGRHNMASATANPDVVRDYLANECVEGQVMGLFNPDDFPLVNVSQFGANPKGSNVVSNC